MRRLVLVRGLPGSGKTTIADSLVRSALMDNPGTECAKMYCADDFFYHGTEYKFDPSKLRHAHDACQRQAFGAMMDDCDLVVVHNTFTQMWEMTPYLAMAKVHDYSVQVIECKGDFGSVHEVPDEAIDRMRARWEEYSDDS